MKAFFYRLFGWKIRNTTEVFDIPSAYYTGMSHPNDTQEVSSEVPNKSYSVGDTLQVWKFGKRYDLRIKSIRHSEYDIFVKTELICN